MEKFDARKSSTNNIRRHYEQHRTLPSHHINRHLLSGQKEKTSTKTTLIIAHKALNDKRQTLSACRFPRKS